MVTTTRTGGGTIRDIGVRVTGDRVGVIGITRILNLKCSLLVGVAILRLDDAGAQRKAQRLGHIAFAVGKQRGVPFFNLQPGDAGLS